MDEQETKKMSKAQFWVRLGVWLVFALVIPVAYIFFAYGIFKDAQPATKLSGWGIFAILFTCVVLIYIMSQAKKSMPKGTMLRQLMDGYTALLPILFLILIIHFVQNNIGEFKTFLIVMLLSEAVAVPINPMPRWSSEYEVDGLEDTLVGIFKRVITKEKSE